MGRVGGEEYLPARDVVEGVGAVPIEVSGGVVASRQSSDDTGCEHGSGGVYEGVGNTV